MGKARLIYAVNDRNENVRNKIVVADGPLYYMDEYTKRFEGLQDFKKDSIYKEKIHSFLRDKDYNDERLYIIYIRNNMSKEILPVLFNDNNIIYNDDNYYDDEISEIEKTRKLLYSSKNKMFLRSFLNCKKLKGTMNFNINLSYDEYKDALKKQLQPFIKDEDYYVSVLSILNYNLSNKKLGKLKTAFEDSLELWKKKMKKLNEEGKYYYSRNLRILINEYNSRAASNRVIRNLNVNSELLNYVVAYNKNNKRNVNGNTMLISMTDKFKQKILVDI